VSVVVATTTVVVNVENVLDLQWSPSNLHTHPLQSANVPHPLETLYSLLTPWLYSLNYFSCGDVIYNISCFYSLGCLSCGHVICGTTIICLIAYTIVGTALTIVDIANGSTLPLIILSTFKFVLSYSLFTLELEAPPSLTLFFFLRAFLGEFGTTFFLFSNAILSPP
jgi:hypothetical protein